MNSNDPKNKENKSPLFNQTKSSNTSPNDDEIRNDREDSYKERLQDKLKLNEIYSWAGSNKEQTICYILLALGLLTYLFLDMFVGGLILGVLAGYYFSFEIMNYLRSLPQVAGGPKQISIIILTAVLFCLLMGSPGIFIGASIAAAFKQAVGGNPN